MNIKYGIQLEIKDMKNLDFSLFLFAVNHEKRGLTAFNRLSNISRINRTVGFRYKSNSTVGLNKDIEELTISNYNEINEWLVSFFKSIISNELNIVIDYSCMTKSWYYTIILFLSQKKLHFENINVFFVYTPSIYAEPLIPKPNTDIAPLPGKYIVPTDKPKALIVCLGYEKSKAEGIVEHLDPKEKYILYSKPALDPDFVSKIEENNLDIITTYKDKVITFPLNDLLKMERELTSLYYLLKDQYSIIIAPLGPKPFTLVAMLLSIKHKDIDIWRVGSGYNINEYDREPIDDNTFIISKVQFA